MSNQFLFDCINMWYLMKHVSAQVFKKPWPELTRRAKPAVRYT